MISLNQKIYKGTTMRRRVMIINMMNSIRLLINNYTRDQNMNPKMIS
jgi:hypothetical protein